MSGLWLLTMLGVWGGLTWLLWKAGRKFVEADLAHRRMRIGLAAALATLWLGVSFWYGGGRKVYYDAEVNRLCRIDGGVKVYETVKLQAEKFDKWGQINFYKPTQGENALGPEYEVKTSVEYLMSDSPSIRRYHVQVFHRRDGRLVGESIGYDRGGGDMPGPWQPSSYSCPKQHGEIVLHHIFVLDQGAKK